MLLMTRKVFGRSVCGAGVAFLMCTGALHAQDVVQRIPLDLGSGALRASLPFDEPVLLVGTASPTLLRVDAQYRQASTFDDAGLDTAECHPSEKQWDKPAPRPWIRPSAAADSFQVLVAPLDPNVYYVFCFHHVSRLTDAQVLQFQETAAGQLDVALRALAPGITDGIWKDAIPPIRGTLLKALPSADSIAIRKGSLLDTSARGDDTLTSQLLQLAQLASYHRNRSQAIRGFTSTANSTSTALHRLSGDTTLGQLLRAYDVAAAKASAVLAPLSDAVIIARLLYGLSEGDATALAEGRSRIAGAAVVAPSVVSDLSVVWDAGSLQGRLENIAATRQALSRVRALVTMAGTNDTFRTALGAKTLKDVAALMATIGAAEELFDATAGALYNQQRLLSDRTQLIATIARTATAYVVGDVTLVGTSIAAFETRARWYVSADVGVAAAPGIGAAAPYFGVNFYPGAVNKRVPLRLRDGWKKRVALTVGLTTSSLARTGRRTDLFGSQSGLFGLGLRVTDAIRFGAGGAIFREVDPNPVTSRERLGWSPFGSASFDWDAKAALGKVGDILFR